MSPDRPEVGGLLAPVAGVTLAELDRVHFVGIGGAGMSGIARVMLQLGVEVSGSDAKDGPVLAQLRAQGARVSVGHDAAHLGRASTVVVSSAIRADNPELVEAHRREARVLPRAAALASLLAGRRGAAVAGTHGKTTTTSMLVVILRELGADPGFVVGGTLAATGTGAESGAGRLLVVEADESDGSFLMLHPAVAVITNVEADHLDNYADLAEIHAHFARFAATVDDTLVVAADDPGAREAAAGATAKIRTFGSSAEADYRLGEVTAEGFTTRYELTGPDGRRRTGRLAVPGEHNARNAAAALALAHVLGHDLDAAVTALAAYRPSGRRLQPTGEEGGVALYDSYAHHPTEVAADLRAMRAALDSRQRAEGRVLVAFQPHLFSRTRAFASEFAAALALADHAAVLPVYAAREDPEPGVNAQLITDDPNGQGRVELHPDRATLPRWLADTARAGDIVLTMGAGDVTDLGPEILAALRSR